LFRLTSVYLFQICRLETLDHINGFNLQNHQYWIVIGLILWVLHIF
jgi:hypothetical protein